MLARPVYPELDTTRSSGVRIQFTPKKHAANGFSHSASKLAMRGSIWGFPKIGDPNFAPFMVGSLL